MSSNQLGDANELARKPLKLTVYVHGDIDSSDVGRAVGDAVRTIEKHPDWDGFDLDWNNRRHFFAQLELSAGKTLTGYRLDVRRPKKSNKPEGEP